MEPPSRISRVSALARPVDPSYPTNRALLLGLAPLLIAGCLYGMLRGGDWAEALWSAGWLVLAAFLGWALARELAPDEDLAAFLAVALTVAAWAVWGDPALATPVAALMAARTVNRSTGAAARPLDTVVLLAAFAAGAWFLSWTVGLVGGLAVALDGVLRTVPGQRPRRRHLAVGAALVAAAGAAWWLGPGELRLPEPAWWPAALVAAGGASLGLQLVRRAVGDADEQPLSVTRVRVGALVAVALVGAASLDPTVEVRCLSVGWAAILAAAVGTAAATARKVVRAGPAAADHLRG